MNVMIYGSKNITFLSDIVKNQIDSYIKSGATFFVGDANGTDCAIQRYLKDKRYRKVKVFYASDNASLSLCKNNLGNWEQVKCSSTDSNSSIDFYNYKYEVMLERCNEVITIKCNNEGDEKFLGKINKTKAPRNVFTHNVIDNSEEKISRLLEEYGMLLNFSSLGKKKHRFRRRIRVIRRMLSKYGYSLLNLSP